MASVRKITVSILGEQYHLVTDEQESEILEAARITELALEELRTKSCHAEISEQHQSTLALLKLSLHAVRQEKEAQVIQKRIQTLLGIVEGVEKASPV